MHASQRHMESSSAPSCVFPSSHHHHQLPPAGSLPRSPTTRGTLSVLVSPKQLQLGYSLQQLPSTTLSHLWGTGDLMLPSFPSPAAHSSGHLEWKGEASPTLEFGVTQPREEKSRNPWNTGDNLFLLFEHHSRYADQQSPIR